MNEIICLFVMNNFQMKYALYHKNQELEFNNIGTVWRK